MVRTNQKATDKNEMELRVIIKDQRVMEIINSIDETLAELSKAQDMEQITAVEVNGTAFPLE